MKQHRIRGYSSAVLRFVVALIVAAGLAGVPSTTALAQTTNVVVNGGFETPLVQRAAFWDLKYAGATTLAPWTIGGHSIDHVGGYWQPAEGAQSINLSGRGPGSVAQVLPTVAGRKYLLRFQYAKNPDRRYGAPRMKVRWGAAANGPFTLDEQFTYADPNSRTAMNWRVVERVVQATGSTMFLSFKSDETDHAFFDDYNPYGMALDDVAATLLPDLATPVLIRVVATGGTGAYLVGRVDRAAGIPLTLQAYTAASCTDGMLPGGGTLAGVALAVTTDAEGYFGVQADGVPAGSFVVVQVTSPVTTASSACVASSADNDFWPKALDLGTAVAARDYIDVAGKARWYRFAIEPGQRIRVALTGLPADYDLAVFRDIGAAFLAQLAPTSAAELTKLSAEYAPSVFSPSVFSPSVFSPSVFSPDAYAPSVFSPSVFSPSVFSPSVFSPSVFSPSVFSPSVFSPSVFSPSVFSPSVFSPSVFSPSVFSPSVFSPDEIAKAFSSAQTRSIIGVSATPGTVEEGVVVNSWNNTGSFYVRVAGRGASYSTAGQFTVTVTKEPSTCSGVTDTTIATRAAAPAAGVRALFVTDSSKLSLDAAIPGGTLGGKLAAFAARTDIGGVVADVTNDPGVVAKRVQADAYPACPFAKNLLAEEIKAVVDSYRPNNPELRYVVVVGGDGVIPFFRYPDQSLLGQESGFVPPVASDSASEASLRRDFVLGQDAYGAGVRVSVRTTSFPVPGLAVGRLVETAADIAGMLDAYADGGGVVRPNTSLVTGYDFLADAATAVQDELQKGTGRPADTLITPNDVSPEDPRSWRASDLGAKLLGSRHDVVFLAGHFSANSALAADFQTSLLTTDLAASTVDLKNAIVFSAGCHSGYNLVDGDAIPGVTLPLDWTQAFAQKQATLIAGTGYQYGDTDFLEYSERLYRNLARQMRASPSGPVAIGDALVRAKLEYLAATPDIRGLHEKALLESTLYGLPMLGVDMPGERVTLPGAGPVIAPVAVPSGPAATLGLKVSDLTVAPTLTVNSATLTSVAAGGGTLVAQWLSGPAGVVSNPAEPALPLAVVNVTPTDGSLVLRGVGFRGGSYSDRSVIPLTGAPTTELRGVHVPFVSPVFFPMRTWNVNYYGALAGGGGTSLLVTPAQHRAEDIAQGTSVLRQTTRLALRLFYSGNLTAASLSDAPTIVNVGTQLDAGAALFAAQVVGDPKAAIHQVWITWTDGLGSWQPLDLAQCVRPAPGAALPSACPLEDSRLWMGRLDGAPPSLRYVVQAASGIGLVTLDDNRGLQYTLAGTPSADSTLVLGATPATATFGDTLPISATLTSAGVPAAGKTVRIAVGASARAGTTDAAGNVTVSVPVNVVPGTYPVTASFAGDDLFAPSAATSAAPLSVGRVPTALASIALSSIGATLTAILDAGSPQPKTQPLLQEAIRFTVSGAGGTKVAYVITDYLGRAALLPTGLPAGSYTVTAEFAGNATYAPATATLQGGLTILPGTITFATSGGSGLPASLTIPGTATFSVSSSSGLPVTVALAPASTAYCTLAVSGGVYTLATTGTPGTCTLLAAAGETTTSTAVSATRDVAIKAPQAISFAPPASLEYQQTLTLPATTDAPASVPVTWSVTGPCSVTGAVLTATAGTGSCQLAASAPENALYAALVRPDFAVIALTRKAQAITFPVVTPPVYAPGGTFAIAATATSGLPVAFSVPATTAVCTVAGTTASIVAAGACTLAADQPGDANYLPAPQVLQTVTIARAAQSITFAGPGDQVFGVPPLALSATATSALPVAFAAAGNCTVAGSTLTLTAAGSCTITASQAGNGNYAPAPDVARAIAIASPDLPNVWTQLTARMTKPRFFHTATRFESGPLAGQVLVAGGYDRTDKPQATSELYNPATRTFTAAGAMPSKSAGHTATLLGSGKVIVLGGGNSSAQLFDPATRTWSSAGSLSSTRSFHTATRLPDGRVLVVGGENNSGTTLATTTIYNPVSGSYANGPTLDTPRSHHTATLLPNGKVLIVGGRKKAGSGYSALASWQLCDATACTTSTGGVAARYSHAAIALGSGGGKVLVAGGTSGSADLASVEVYDAQLGTWTAAGFGSLNPARRYLTLSELPNGRLLAVGGSSAGTARAAADAYTPPFAPVAPMNLPRAGHTATVLQIASGEITGILVLGGAGDDVDGDDALDRAEVYGTP